VAAPAVAAAPTPPPAPVAPQAPAQAPAAAVPAGAIAAGSSEAGHLYVTAAGARVEVAVAAGPRVFCTDAAGQPVILAPTDPLWPSPAPVGADARFSPGWTPPPPPAPAPAPTAGVLPPDAPVSAGAAAPPVEDKPKRGRKPKAAKAEAGTEAAATDGDDVLVLFVDCVPVGDVNVHDLAGYVVEVADKVAKAAGVDDVRLAPKDNPLAYGAWRGALAAAARSEAPTGYCTIGSGDLADPVIEGLAAVAALVVRPLGRR
jgi:hypothetical protein